MKKYDTGYITGVFDLFHIGHLNALKKAKEMCNTLIAAVSTDEHVFDYKNKIPVIPFKERFAIVDAIKYVDLTIPQAEYDKIKVWKEHKFNVVFIGDDWKGSERWTRYEKQLNEVGVDVIYLPYTQGVSSTLLTNALKNLG